MSALTVRTPDSGFENLDRRYESVARWVPFVLLVVPFIPYVLSQAPSAGAVGITVGVAVAAGAWVAWMVLLHPGPPRRPWQGYVYFAGLLVLIAVLAFRSPWFAFFIWIGYLQWMHHNGFAPPRDPVLEPIESIRLRDAILDPVRPKRSDGT